MATTEPLQVTISGPSLLAPGVDFTLDAAYSGGLDAPNFSWDCDGDGGFEVDTAAVASVGCPGLPVGTYTLSVLATDPSGIDDDTLVLEVVEAGSDDTGPPTTGGSQTGTDGSGGAGETGTPTSDPGPDQPTGGAASSTGSGDSLGGDGGDDAAGGCGCRDARNAPGTAFFALLLLLRRRRAA